MKQLNYKKGISLIVLVITLVVLLIIVGTAVYRSDSSREVAQKTIIINEFTTVQDAVRAYFAFNGTYPISNKASKSSYNMDEVTALNTDVNLLNDIKSFSDDNCTFYVVDLSLLDVSEISYGTHYVSLEENDFFVVSSGSLNVYYVKGIKIRSNRYYSLSAKLTLAKDFVVTPSEDSSYTSISSVIKNGRISLIQSDLSILDSKIVVKINDGESLETKTDSYLNSLSINSGNNILNIRDILTTNQLTELETTHRFEVNIVRNSNVIESKSFDVADITGGSSFDLASDSLRFYENSNNLSFKINAPSGIAYVKYAPYNVFDSTETSGYKSANAQLTNENNWINYVKNNGKTVVPNKNNICSINEDKNVKTVFVYAEDKSGRAIYGTKDFYSFYASSKVKDYSNGEANIISSVIAPVGTTVTISYSDDGNEFIKAENFNMDEKVCSFDYTTYRILYSKIYIKITLNIIGSEYSFIEKIDTVPQYNF